MKTPIFVLLLLLLSLAEVQTGAVLGTPLLPIKTLQLSESQELKIKILPHEQISFSFNSQQIIQKIELDISSTASYQICILNAGKKCASSYVRHSKKENSLTLSRQQITYGIRIKNPSNKKKIKVVINYHIQNQQCHKLQSRVFHRKQLKHNSCFLFQLNKQEDVQLVIIKEQTLDLKYKLQLCGKDYNVTAQNFKYSKFSIHFVEIIRYCKASQNMTLKLNISHQQNKNESKNNPFIGLILEYLQQSIIVPEGIAYVSSFDSDINAKIFEYELLDKENTTINVISDLSLQIYVKVVEETQKDKTIPNKNNFDFSSKTGFIFSYFRPYLLITKETLQKYKCKECYLIVGVFAPQKFAQIAKNNKFSLEITQYSSTLVDGVMKHHFLQAGAFAFYTFTAQTQAVTVYQMSDNNKNCASFYLSDQEVAGPENYLKKSQKNRIVYKSESNKPYFVGVKAESDCAYSISATTASNQFVTLEKGRFGYLNLLKNEIKFFLIQASRCEYIKLLSLHLYGSVQIYLNKTDISTIKQIKKDQIDYNKFQKKGQYLNKLLLTSKDELFCEGCFYLVAVVAKKLTESTLFYGDQNTPIPIHQKIINDIIPYQGNRVKGEYSGQPKFQLQVKIHSGRLRLIITKGQQKFTKVYQEIDEVSKQVVDLGGSNNFLMILASVLKLQTIEVQFEALQNNTIYSIRFKQIEQGIISSFTNLLNQETPSQPLQKIQSYSLQPGHDLYLPISSEQTTVIQGYFRDSSQKILLSSDIGNSQQFSDLNLFLLVDGKKMEYKLQKMKNIVTLQIPKLKNYSIKEGIKYKLSITVNSSASFWLTIMQTQDFQLLSPSIYTVVHDNYTFVTHTQSELIVEIFECKGKASLIYAPQRQSLDSNKSLMDMVGLANQPHAMRITRFSTTFYEVRAEQAILRWFPFKMEQGIGTGYIDYKVGSLNYESNIISIKLNWQSLSMVQTKNKLKSKPIQNISYVIYIATTQNELNQYSQCEPFLLAKRQQTMKIENIVEDTQSKQLNKSLSYSISKRQLMNKFGQNETLYATIVAQLILSQNVTTPKSQKQRYRFIYPQIQIPNDLLQPSYVAAVIESNYDQLISAVILVVAAIAISTYLLTKKLMPVLGILKNRYFVQENEQIGLPIENVIRSENGNQQVPQSSDRRGVGTGSTIEVDEKS